MTTQSRELKSLSSTDRYKLKEIDAPLSILQGGFPPEWVLKTMEEHHEEGYRVCGVSMAAGGQAIWIFYEQLRQN